MYKFHIYDEPKRNNYFHYGMLKRVIYKDGDIIIGDQTSIKKASKNRLRDDISNLERIIIETHYQKKSAEPFPNFLQIRFALDCADNKALYFLNTHNISYSKFPVEIMNETDREYSMIFFEEKSDLLDLKKSNLYLNEEGYAITNNRDAYYPTESREILKGSALKLKGIFSIRELRLTICDEETKKALEKSELNGFRFEELEVSSN